MCKAFPQTLTNAARDWFSTLEPNSIAWFSDLSDKFLAFFASSKRIRKTATSRMQLRQGPNETLRGFMTRFNKERLQILDLYITAIVFTLTYAIRCEAFTMSLSKIPPQTVIELLTRAEKYINMEKTLNPKRPGPSYERAENKRQHDITSRHEYPWDKHKSEGSSSSDQVEHNQKKTFWWRSMIWKSWSGLQGWSRPLTQEIGASIVNFTEIMGIPQRTVKTYSGRFKPSSKEGS